jgi:hypothetical protein
VTVTVSNDVPATLLRNGTGDGLIVVGFTPPTAGTYVVRLDHPDDPGNTLSVPVEAFPTGARAAVPEW